MHNRALARLLIAFGLLVTGGGCFRHQTHLPGVIDMRTDGSGLVSPAEVATDSRQSRPGTAGLAEGTGLTAYGPDLSIEDRHFWIYGSIPIYNQSPAPELDAALKATGALTELEVGEDIDAIDLAATVVAPFILPVASWVLPPHTFHARARAVVWPPASPTATTPTIPGVFP